MKKTIKDVFMMSLITSSCLTIVTSIINAVLGIMINFTYYLGLGVLLFLAFSFGGIVYSWSNKKTRKSTSRKTVRKVKKVKQAQVRKKIS